MPCFVALVNLFESSECCCQRQVFVVGCKHAANFWYAGAVCDAAASRLRAVVARGGGAACRCDWAAAGERAMGPSDCGTHKYADTNTHTHNQRARAHAPIGSTRAHALAVDRFRRMAGHGTRRACAARPPPSRRSRGSSTGPCCARRGHTRELLPALAAMAAVLVVTAASESAGTSVATKVLAAAGTEWLAARGTPGAARTRRGAGTRQCRVAMRACDSGGHDQWTTKSHATAACPRVTIGGGSWRGNVHTNVVYLLLQRSTCLAVMRGASFWVAEHPPDTMI